MKRFALYKGVAPHLVAHPGTGSTGLGAAPDGGPARTFRFVGMRRLSNEELRAAHGGELPSLAECELFERFEPVEEVVDVTHPDVAKTLAKAVRRGELEQVGKVALHRDLKSARARLLRSEPKAPKPPKKTSLEKGAD